MPKKLTYEELEQRVKGLEKETAELQQAGENMGNLNLLLRTIRNVNQLLVKERDQGKLIQGICRNLVDNRSYFNAWIAILDESGRLVTSAEEGLGEEFVPMVERMERGELTHCAQMALMQSEVVLIEDPTSICKDCPLSIKYAGRGGMTVRLQHGEKVYGILSVSTPRELVPDEEEQGLFKEVAGDIAFGIYRIGLERAQKRVEKALRESDERLSQIVHRSSIPTFVIDNNHIVTHWNKACENLTGISSTEVVGTKNQWLAFYSAERPVMADLIVDNALEKGISKYYGGKYRKSDVSVGGYEAEDFFPALGKEGKWIFFTAAPLKDVEGRISGAIETLQDMTERNQAVETMQKSLYELGERVKELNCLFAISSLVEKRDILLEEILQGTVNLIPPAWEYPEITCARVILEGQEFRTSNFEETIWNLSKDIIVHGETNGTLEVRYLEERPERYEGPFLEEARALINAIAERLGRIIERKRAEKALGESEERFRNLIENSLTGISITQDDRIVYQNPEQERVFGSLPRKCKLAELEGIHPDDVEKVKQLHYKVISKEVQTLDTDFRFYPVDEAGNRLDMKWVYCRASLIEYQGREAMLVNIMDITRAKELERLLRVQDKMSSLGRVAAGIAHEIRNPLSGINIYLNTLEKIYDKAENLDKVKGILGQLQSASMKIESVIRRVMDFSKPGAPKLVLTDINQPIEEAIKLSSVTLRKIGIDLERALAEDLLPCHIDPNLIEQVILNLITNAFEAMKNVDRVRKLRITSSLKNNRIVVRVSDSGPGVSQNIRDKIFDAYYTTKSEGTGIGLSLCQRIITDHGGFLDVAKSKWDGAEFTIMIPVEKGKDQR